MRGWGHWSGPRVLGKLLHIRQDPMHRDHICSDIFHVPPQSLMPLHHLLYYLVNFYLCISSFHLHLSDSSHLLSDQQMQS